MPGASKWRSEFLINTTSGQSEPTLTALADGRFAAAWTDHSQIGDDPSGSAVRGQVFNADGSRSGGEFLINTTTTNDQSTPAIAALADGRFVVAWTDLSESAADISGSAVRGQMFNADGSRSGGEFLINTITTNFQFAPTITALPDGRFVVAWTDLSETAADTSGSAVRGQVFQANGTKAGPEFLVNTTMANGQSEPAITALPDGRFVAAWSDASETAPDTSGNAVRGQVFQADGTKAGPEFLVNTTTVRFQFDPSITALPDGRFVVAWRDDSQTDPDPIGNAVRGQVFQADGTKAGPEFLVNTTVTSHQFAPTITALPDGRFVVAWIDGSQASGASGFAVRGQVLQADGTKSGSEFLVNTTTNFQFAPTITTLPDGRFVVAWTDQSPTAPDTSFDSVRGQIFDPRETGLSLSGTALSDDFVGTDFADSINGLGGNDRMDGEGGSDILRGGLGDDTLLGDAGNDELFGDAGSDALFGDAGNDRLFGDAGNDALFGDAGNDRLDGGSGHDRLFGGLGKDRLSGGIGNDKVYGGFGNDVLAGQGGRDAFVFDSKLGTARTDRTVNIDRIVDFNVKFDSLWLDNAVFRKLGQRGTEDHPAKLKKAYFEVGDRADDRNDYLIYNDQTGILSYDADGSGRGRAVEFAQLAKHLKLTYHDFFVI